MFRIKCAIRLYSTPFEFLWTPSRVKGWWIFTLLPWIDYNVKIKISPFTFQVLRITIRIIWIRQWCLCSILMSCTHVTHSNVQDKIHLISWHKILHSKKKWLPNSDIPCTVQCVNEYSNGYSEIDYESHQRIQAISYKNLFVGHLVDWWKILELLGRHQHLDEHAANRQCIE